MELTFVWDEDVSLYYSLKILKLEPGELEIYRSNAFARSRLIYPKWKRIFKLHKDKNCYTNLLHVHIVWTKILSWKYDFNSKNGFITMCVRNITYYVMRLDSCVGSIVWKLSKLLTKLQSNINKISVKQDMLRLTYKQNKQVQKRIKLRIK